MAATVEITQVVEVIGLAGGDDVCVTKFTHSSTPTEIVKGKPIIANTAVTLDLGDIAAGSGFVLYIEALVGNVYVLLNATSGTPVSTTAELYIREGTGYTIPINPNATAMAGIRLVSDSATGQIKYMLVG
jgi:hypothetical protein